MTDAVPIIFISICAPLLLIAFLSFILHYFVALKAEPTKRALWIVGLAYAIASIVLIITLPFEYALYAPLASLPGGLIAFLFWRNDFRRDWIENEGEMPEGVEVLDDDWRSGLARLGILVVVVAAAALLRFLRQF